MDSILYVAPSSIPEAGMGVFVKKYCPRRMRIGFYDGYVVEGRYLTDREYGYGIPDMKDRSLIGFTKIRNPRGVAQLVNDACKPNLGQGLENLSLPQRIKKLCLILLEYTNESMDKENVICNPELVLVARKPIQAGEECFFSYSLFYWLDWYCRRTDEPRLITAFSLMHSLVLEQTKECDRKDLVLALQNIYARHEEELLPFRLRWKTDKTYQEREKQVEEICNRDKRLKIVL
ncbi:SET domain-containing protein [Cedratvirus kamchatka]|uniref:SET domain-containing protein n=1 Tax=Cedratvirus kamchatka TaxID=2716914 RepID=A0A6G8MYX8_9VIRU|nr:SET domain-containing protein [Cedratvirus kamchatka]WIL04858.1 SET domain-containing protein [Cedratvirus duvanny]